MPVSPASEENCEGEEGNGCKMGRTMIGIGPMDLNQLLVQIPTLPLSSCVTLGRLLNLSESVHPQGVWWEQQAM